MYQIGNSDVKLLEIIFTHCEYVKSRVNFVRVVRAGVNHQQAVAKLWSMYNGNPTKYADR